MELVRTVHQANTLFQGQAANCRVMKSVVPSSKEEGIAPPFCKRGDASLKPCLKSMAVSCVPILVFDGGLSLLRAMGVGWLQPTLGELGGMPYEVQLG